MATLDQIQARLRLELSRAMAAHMKSTPTGPGPDADRAATLADEIEARLMQPASPTEEAEALATCTGLLQDEESMPTLTEEIKTFIVKGLACYDTPSHVAEAVKVNFNVEISRQHVYAYDPDSSQHMAPRWRELHATTRHAFLRETAEIGIAHRAVRLRRLDRLAGRCERNSVALALKCLEIAAKESGGLYENRKPIVSQSGTSQPTTPEIRAPQPAMIQSALQPAASPVATPQPSTPPPVMKQPSMPERAARQPQITPPHPAPLSSVPLPVMPQPETPAPSPLLAVLAQPPQPATLSEGRPLTREERYLAYVRDSNARARAVAAQALLDSVHMSPAISRAPSAS